MPDRRHKDSAKKYGGGWFNGFINAKNAASGVWKTMGQAANAGKSAALKMGSNLILLFVIFFVDQIVKKRIICRIIGN